MIFLLLVVLLLLSVIAVLHQTIRYYRRWIDEERLQAEKGLTQYRFLVRWVELKQNHVAMGSYFLEHRYQTAAIYGMKEVGELLLRELKQEGIPVLCAIDQNADAIRGEIPVIKPSDSLPEADVIIVTIPHYFDSVYAQLQKVTTADIVSVEDLLWSVSESGRGNCELPDADTKENR